MFPKISIKEKHHTFFLTHWPLCVHVCKCITQLCMCACIQMVYITYLDAHIFIWNTHTSFSFNTPATTPVTQSLTTAGHKDGFVCEVA